MKFWKLVACLCIISLNVRCVKLQNAGVPTSAETSPVPTSTPAAIASPVPTPMDSPSPSQFPAATLSTPQVTSSPSGTPYALPPPAATPTATQRPLPAGAVFCDQVPDTPSLCIVNGQYVGGVACSSTTEGQKVVAIQNPGQSCSASSACSPSQVCTTLGPAGTPTFCYQTATLDCIKAVSEVNGVPPASAGNQPGTGAVGEPAGSSVPPSSSGVSPITGGGTSISPSSPKATPANGITGQGPSISPATMTDPNGVSPSFATPISPNAASTPQNSSLPDGFVQLDFTIYLTDFDLTSFDQNQQDSYKRTIQGLAPGIREVDILSTRSGSVYVDTRVILPEASVEEFYSALKRLPVNQSLKPMANPAIDINTAVRQLAGNPCPQDCPGFSNSHGVPVCGHCCWRGRVVDEPCPAFYDRPNGCGSGEGFLTKLTQFLIRSFGPVGTLDIFTPFCDIHDICYSTPYSGQETCDQAMLQQLLGVCTLAFPPVGSAGDFPRVQCLRDATMVYEALSIIGGSAYDDAQSKELAYIENCRQQCNDGTCAAEDDSPGQPAGTCRVPKPPPPPSPTPTDTAQPLQPDTTPVAPPVSTSPPVPCADLGDCGPDESTTCAATVDIPPSCAMGQCKCLACDVSVVSVRGQDGCSTRTCHATHCLPSNCPPYGGCDCYTNGDGTGRSGPYFSSSTSSPKCFSA